MNRPLISIALCTYNGQRYLKDQLDSILTQSYKNIEIIAVDDCSSDLTFDILLDYAATYSNIKVHRNDSRLGYNLNFGKALRLCTGELIAISDQDDIWRNDKLEIQYKSIKDNMLIYCDSHFIDSNGKSMNYKMSDKFNFYGGSQPEVFLFSNCVSGHTILMRKSILQLALPFPDDFHYDQWLAFVSCCTGSIDFVNETLVHYRIHDHNCTDVLALKKKKVKAANDALEKLNKESNWLKMCSLVISPSQQLIHSLYQKSLRNNVTFFNSSFGYAIWKNRNTLLYLMKKSNLSKSFFVLKKSWGLKAKRLL